ncbi:class I SAM-dependent methyltransferase [Cetobacterium somerae]|uniref:class I SAM-dependent methyltransferase n=1 Tax=Cetobacterium somerae TaxID=188913 RepID=UPI00211E8371|nr:class I SAM-dependent methyltransferase [Cetobacterium somerae]MCQ9628120.1 class I SAM-dependent methyltransferase [Cetobacterium somerae]
MKYDFEFSNLIENDSHSIILKKINKNSKILEFGPATGKMTKYLKENLECRVDIVEYDIEAGIEAAQFAEKKFLGEQEGNIEIFFWYNNLIEEKYDYILFADVLEHLREPLKVLIKAKELLKEKGSFLVSIPNISHNSIIIDLIKGEFNYQERGILDNTHLKFFTDKSFKRELSKTELIAITTEATYLTPKETEFNNNYSDIEYNIAEILKSRLDGHVYQYVYEIKKNRYCIENNISEAVKLISPKIEKAKLYIKEAEDCEFSELKKVEIKYGYTDLELNFDLKIYNNIKELRLDPTEGCSYFSDLNLIGKNSLIEKDIEFESNYLKSEKGYVFGDDPQLYIKNIDFNIEQLQLKIRRS